MDGGTQSPGRNQRSHTFHNTRPPHISTSVLNEPALASSASSSTSKHGLVKRVSRALSAHVNPFSTSPWDPNYSRPHSAASMDTMMTASSGHSGPDSRAPAVQSPTMGATSGVDGSSGTHTWRGRLSSKKAMQMLPKRGHSSSPGTSSSQHIMPLEHAQHQDPTQQSRGRHSNHHNFPISTRSHHSASSPALMLQRKERKPSFYFDHGRRFISNMPSTAYRYPSDLREFQRQNLLLRLLSDVFGSPISIPIDRLNPPQIILDVGCGTGYWAELVHNHYVRSGLNPPRIVGVDLIDMAGDLHSKGVDWVFVQHNAMAVPFPFPNETFDLVHFGSMHFIYECNWKDRWAFFKRWMSEWLRILKPGGFLETRDVEHAIRRVIPNRGHVSISEEEAVRKEPNIREDLMQKLGCYLIDSRTTATVIEENPFLSERNAWLLAYLEIHGIKHTTTEEMVGVKIFDSPCQVTRIAMPLSNIIATEQRHRKLTDEQLAIRTTALELVIKEMESLEEMYKEVSGKTENEWNAWWDCMVEDLVEDNGCAAGECLIAAEWWCQFPDRDYQFKMARR